jgi:hypothetical protein
VVGIGWDKLAIGFNDYFDIIGGQRTDYVATSVLMLHTAKGKLITGARFGVHGHCWGISFKFDFSS